MKSGMTRKQFLQTALWGGASVLAAPRALGAWQVSGPPLDAVIKGGRVIDGTGRAAFDAAIGIRGGVIADIGAIPDSAAQQVIDAKGQYVCPGFIDPHAHEEILMIADPVLEKFVRQGVTTLVNGNCGHSVTPYRSKTVFENIVRKATELPAEQFRINDRGVLAKGKVADVMVFNPDDYSYPTPAESDPNDPYPVAKGVQHVVVNGVPVLHDGKLTGQKPGKVLI
jgi:N-acyl-D-aspartate/D-glutamate deacylase